MKQYFLFIDEAGQFLKPAAEQYKSLVGGFYTSKPYVYFIKQIDEICNIEKYKTAGLSKDDIHAAELLHPKSEVYKSKENSKKYNSIDEDIRQDFINDIYSVIKDETFVKSENLNFEFGLKDPQERYGQCLINLLNTVAIKLKQENINDNFELNVLIANRNASCLPSGSRWQEYHKELDNIAKINTEKQGIKINMLSNRLKYNTKKIFLDLADVACYYLRNDKTKEINTLTSNTVDDKSIKYIDLRNDYIDLTIKNEDYFTAYKLTKENSQKPQILKHLDSLTNEYQLENFIVLASSLVKNRKLSEAISILEPVIKSLETLLINKPQSKSLNNLLQKSLKELQASYNHQGKVGTDELSNKFKNLAEQQPTSIIQAHLDDLDFTNRACNNQFNNYDFDSIENILQNKISNHEKMIDVLNITAQDGENVSDYLLHKAYSTIGQSYAFMGNEDFVFAIEQFDKSMQHFDKSNNDYRTVLYLSTTYWQYDDLDNAKKILKKYSLYQNIGEFTPLDNENTNSCGFRLLSLLRIWIFDEYPKVITKSITSIIKQIDNLEDEHPKELLYKWVGFHYMQQKQYDKAIKYFKKAICINTDFTIQTINISAKVLMASCYSQKNDLQNYKTYLADIEQDLQQLTKQSSYFNDYIDNLGGLKNIKQLIANNNFKEQAFLMPFNYA